VLCSADHCRALYLDGNNLQCDGAIQLIKPFAEQALLTAQKQDADAADEAAAAAAAVSADKQGQGT